LVELSLHKIWKKKPGFVPRYKHPIKQVDKLEVYNNFYTDVNGVYKADPKSFIDQGIYINKDGFRSIEFNDYQNNGNEKFFPRRFFYMGC
jgi:hypothetical protein